VTDFGYHHKTNASKFRILEVLMWANKPLTVRDIESKTGIYHTKISCAMSHYRKIVKQNGKIIKLPYIQRLEKKGPNGLYRYKITKSGIKAYVSYLGRIKRGFSLKRVGKVQRMETYGMWDHSQPKTREDYNVTPEMLAPYIGLSRRGYELEFKIKDIFDIEKYIIDHPDFFDNRITKNTD